MEMKFNDKSLECADRHVSFQKLQHFVIIQIVYEVH
jgi:hypothetical protein